MYAVNNRKTNSVTRGNMHRNSIRPELAPATNRVQPFLFLRLPAEIRNFIYELLGQAQREKPVEPKLQSSKRRNHGSLGPQQKFIDPGFLSLAMANRQLYNEAILLYMEAMPTFRFYEVHNLRRFVDRNGPTQRNLIKSVRFGAHNAIVLAELFNALTTCEGLEKLELEVSLYGDYGEQGILSQPTNDLETLAIHILSGCLFPPGLKDFIISRHLPSFARDDLQVTKKWFDYLVVMKVGNRINNPEPHRRRVEEFLAAVNDDEDRAYENF